MFERILGPSLKDKHTLLGIYAAAIAFYFILSIVPFLIMTFTLIGYLSPVDMSRAFADILAQAFPPEARIDTASIIQTVKKSSGGGFMTVSFLVALWTSWNFMLSWVDAMQFIFSNTDRIRNRSWKEWVKSILILVVWMLTFVLTAYLLILSPMVEKWLQSFDFVTQFALFLWAIIRYGSLFIVLYLAFRLSYSLVTTSPSRRKWLRQGSILAALGWMGVSFVFSNILPHIWNQNALYGALGSIVATMVWAYCVAWVMIGGACWVVRFSPGDKK